MHLGSSDSDDPGSDFLHGALCDHIQCGVGFLDWDVPVLGSFQFHIARCKI
jgi:hypothetical protein